MKFIDRDSNGVLIISVELGTLIIELRIGDPYGGENLFNYETHFKWIKSAYTPGSYDPYELERMMSRDRYKDKKLVLFPNGDWEWWHKDFDLNFNHIPF